MKRSGNEWFIAPATERLVLVCAGASVIFGVVDLVDGGIASGVLFVALGLGMACGMLLQVRRSRTGDAAPNTYHVAKALLFFGLCAVGGAVLFVLAIVGATAHPVPDAVVGLTVSGLEHMSLQRPGEARVEASCNA